MGASPIEEFATDEGGLDAHHRQSDFRQFSGYFFAAPSHADDHDIDGLRSVHASFSIVTPFEKATRSLMLLASALGFK